LTQLLSSPRRTQLLFSVIVERIDSESGEETGKVRERLPPPRGIARHVLPVGRARRLTASSLCAHQAHRKSMDEKTLAQNVGGLEGLGDFSDWKMDMTKMEVRTAHAVSVARTCDDSHCNGSLVWRMERLSHAPAGPSCVDGDGVWDNRWARASPAGASPTCTWVCIAGRRWR
jgi:hypothetical protein